MHRVGIVAYALDRSPGGIARYGRELIRALKDEGVALTSLEAGGRASHDGVVGLPGAGLLPALLTIGQVAIARQAQRLGLDLVHDPTGTMPLFLTGARRVVTIHDVVPYIYPETSTRLDWLIYRWWLPLAITRADAVITDSQQSKSDIVRHLGVKPGIVTVIPLAAGSKYRPLGQAETDPVLRQLGIDPPYILYVGSVEARKNLVRLLEAYALLRSQSVGRGQPHHTLVIVGARKWKSSPVFAAVQRLGLAQHVRFTGFVDDQDLPALYNGASVFAFPSLYEGFGLPVLEAMSCGTPVVTSSSSSLAEVAADAALLVDPSSPVAIARGIARLLEDSELASEMAKRGLERARGFSWERTAHETIGVYERVLGKPRVAGTV